MRPLVLGILAAATAASFAAPATAQSFPAKPIRIVVPATPGGAIDLAARVIGDKLAQAWGQPVVVDNKPGAAGISGTDIVAKAPADGYTFALVASSHAINATLYGKLPYDTQKDFTPVALTHVVPLVLVVNNNLPAKSVRDFANYLKANPGKVSYASSGNGGAPHLSAELFKSLTATTMTHIPYKGSTAAHTDLISGEVQAMFDTVVAIGPQIKAGKVRPLGVTTAKRSAALPEVPTIAESGVSGYETSTWGGLIAPAGTPKDIVAKVNAEVNRILKMPDVRERLQASGAEPASGSADDFERFIQSEMQKWGQVVKASGATATQ
ncbi:tripartite tricarboxylate transporter substrate binding protein [Variovorax sp. LjRoot290]|uniref:tripartite tricarboxylate transporter substrate binding protein n=1 Tax=unclassified Variovorax TaxID=663243 RepID=UPI003ECFA27C